MARTVRLARVQLIREIPDVGLASRFDGEPLVQSFLVDGVGRAWITTREAFEIPGFGAPWVAGQLAALRAELGADELERALRDGLRLRAEVLALAA
jgi:hypothetical protein